MDQIISKSDAIDRAMVNHYKLGFRSNGMTVWDVKDTVISKAGKELGEQPFVSYCYHRPRHLPYSPYNRFSICGGNTRVRKMQLTDNPWTEDPGCYLPDEEIGVELKPPRVTNRSYRKGDYAHALS